MKPRGVRKRIGTGLPDWPRGPFSWDEDRTLFISIPFTWNLPEIRRDLEHGSFLFDRAIVGGPAVDLLPDFMKGIPGVEIGRTSPGILQRVNPLATRSTESCPRRCDFCGVGRGMIEPGGFRELPEWPDLPIYCDNNLFASSLPHFDRVISRLKVWGWCDFNQGVDARLLTPYHAAKLKEVGAPLVRLALDHPGGREAWLEGFGMLRAAKIQKKAVRSYALVGYDTGPEEAWERCRWIEKHGVRVLPMWYHRLDALEYNAVTLDQKKLGWTDEKRKDLMMFYYQHIVRANRRERRFYNPDQGGLW